LAAEEAIHEGTKKKRTGDQKPLEGRERGYRRCHGSTWACSWSGNGSGSFGYQQEGCEDSKSNHKGGESLESQCETQTPKV